MTYMELWSIRGILSTAGIITLTAKASLSNGMNAMMSLSGKFTRKLVSTKKLTYSSIKRELPLTQLKNKARHPKKELKL